MKVFLKLLAESFIFALHAIRSNKLRTILSLLGITIGIFCVVFIFTATGSVERKIRDTLSDLEDNVVFIQKWPWAINDPDYAWWKYIKRPEPRVEEVDLLLRRSTTIESAAYITSVSRTIIYEGKHLSGTTFMGVSEGFSDVWSYDISGGRPITEQEFSSGRNVVLLGAEVASQLFGTTSPIGKEVRVFNRKAIVIGVFSREGEDAFGESLDGMVVTPINFFRKHIDLAGGSISGSIIVKAKPHISIPEMKDEVTSIMRAIRRLKPDIEDDFAINQANVLSAGVDSIFRVVTLAGWLIGGFALLVGAFGIANIMYVSVYERIHQIGIQKSLGAKKYFILLQFLAESIFLSLFGGMTGLLLTFSLSTAISTITSFSMQMSFGNWSFGLLISIITGLIAGIMPAIKASSMDPVEAIRSNS